MDDRPNVSGVHFIKVENVNDLSFSDGCDDVNKYSQTDFVQENIKGELCDESTHTYKTENDHLAFRDEDNEKIYNNEIDTIYIKKEPVLDEDVEVEDKITDINEYKTENDPLALRDEENERIYNNETNTIYIKEEPVFAEDDKVEEEITDTIEKNKKLNSNKDQQNIVQCRASHNLESVLLKQNQFLTQLLKYEESHECITPKVILHRNTDISGDGNCLFHSLICVLQLQISSCDLRRQLRDSPYLNSCQNPQAAYNKLSSNDEYGDLDCVYLFAKTYNQNICVHSQFFNVISKKEDTRFCHFKANDTYKWIHLDLRKLHFTPYFSDDEKKREDERKRKQKHKEYSKRYRDKKRLSNLQKGLFDRHMLDVQPVIYTSQIAGSSTGGVPHVPPVICSSHNEDQDNFVLCRASQNLENVQLEQNRILTQQLRVYEESHECITPKVILHRNTDIPGDGNCLFHSLIRVLKIQILTCDLRRHLCESPYLNSCQNPQAAYNKLSSNNEYGDLDCVYLFAKTYNQNICVHSHYFNVISKNEDTRFCHFKANDTENWIHLDLRGLYFTPYFSDDEKKKEDERKQKQKNKEYCKRYRDKKRSSNLQKGQSDRDMLDVQPVIYTSQIAGLSTGGVPHVPPVICSSQNEDQDNFVLCRASQNLENVQLEQNRILTQHLHIYEKSPVCITPDVILHRNTDIPGDGNCLFHSLIRVLKLQILTCDLRRQLRDSPYLNSCQNPQAAYNKLSSNNEYGDLDSVYLFAKTYNQNICVHSYYFNVISKNDDICFCHFKANDTENWIHLDLRGLYFTPYFSDDEKKKEDERKQKQKNKEYSKRYRDKKRLSNLQKGLSDRDMLDVQPVIYTSQIAGPSTRGVPHVSPVICTSQNEDQDNFLLCRASQNLENVQLEQNRILTQHLRIYEESPVCITPNVILHRNTDIPGGGNCLFHSLIRVLNLQILTYDLRRQLRDSPYLNSCQNPQAAYNKLSSNNEYGDLDCVYLFAKTYNQNICVHSHYFNVISKNDDICFCHFKANDTENWIHLDLRALYFTPYFSDDEKKKEDERKQKQKNKEYSKRYRDKKRLSKLQKGLSDRDMLDVQPVIHTSQITSPSTRGVQNIPPIICCSENADLSSK